MARAGRKRRDRLAVREPVMQATPERMAQRIAIVGGRTVDDLERGRRAAWEAWDGTLLEALFHREWIDAAGLTAGRRFDALCKRYRALLLVPKQIFEPREAEPIFDPEREAEIFHETRDQYEAATAAIGDMRSRRIVADVLRGDVCTSETWAAFEARYWGHLADVRMAFHRLARYYRDA